MIGVVMVGSVKATKELISNFPVLNQVAEFNNTSTADKFLEDNEVDLIFLDIEIPGVNGLEFAKTIAPETLIISTTAYKEYAVEKLFAQRH